MRHDTHLLFLPCYGVGLIYLLSCHHYGPYLLHCSALPRNSLVFGMDLLKARIRYIGHEAMSITSLLYLLLTSQVLQCMTRVTVCRVMSIYNLAFVMHNGLLFLFCFVHLSFQARYSRLPGFWNHRVRDYIYEMITWP